MCWVAMGLVCRQKRQNGIAEEIESLKGGCCKFTWVLQDGEARAAGWGRLWVFLKKRERVDHKKKRKTNKAPNDSFNNLTSYDAGLFFNTFAFITCHIHTDTPGITTLWVLLLPIPTAALPTSQLPLLAILTPLQYVILFLRMVKRYIFSGCCRSLLFCFSCSAKQIAASPASLWRR
jgi:hypothetical protein